MCLQQPQNCTVIQPLQWETDAGRACSPLRNISAGVGLSQRLKVAPSSPRPSATSPSALAADRRYTLYLLPAVTTTVTTAKLSLNASNWSQAVRRSQSPDTLDGSSRQSPQRSTASHRDERNQAAASARRKHQASTVSGHGNSEGFKTLLGGHVCFLAAPPAPTD